MQTDRENFGAFFRALRLGRGKTLRKFCIENKFDATSISKIERGLYPAPHSSEKMLEYANALAVVEGSDDWVTLFDLWSRAKKYTEPETLPEKALPDKLPILFRTEDNKDLSSAKLDEVIEIVRTS